MVNPTAAFGAALERLVTALALAPGDAKLWAQFSDLIRWFNLRHPIPEAVRALLARALEHPAVDPGNLVRPISTLALSRGNAFDEPLLLPLLEAAVIRDASLEQQIVEVRRRMLAGEQIPASVQVAVAHQCFNTEYVFEETDAERTQLERLRVAMPPDWHVVYGAYRPLLGLDVPAGSLRRRQVDEPIEEARLRGQMPSLGAHADAVSTKVREQYEANPYPRWLRTQTAGFEAPAHPLARNPRILIAGCGTGQHAIATALRYPGSSVLALDLSLASLGYAARKTRELGITNIEYRQADLLALDRWPERFDLIESSGVLHHLRDPLAGWRILAGLRKPGGLMRLGLYSAAGRRDVARARALIAERGFKPDPEGIRACRTEIRAREGGDPLLARIARNEDFFSMSGCRDLLFHAHEIEFSLQEIEGMVAALGLRFLGFDFPDSGETLARFKGDPASLADWRRHEQDYPDTFSRLYQFWVV